MHFKNWAAAFLLSQMAGVLASPADHEEPTGSFTLAPSPTGKVCQPHGDHWHCDPVAKTSDQVVPTPEPESCEPHGDHWHCPDGVPEPTTPPPNDQATTTPANTQQTQVPSTTTSTKASATCEPHGDHWHCPPGVEEPENPPQSGDHGDHDHDHDHDHSSTSTLITSTPSATGNGNGTTPTSTPTSSPVSDGAKSTMFTLTTAITCLMGAIIFGSALA